jgi:phosphoglycolate phosphatase
MADARPASSPTLVFDLDGTLIDTVEDLVAALNVVAGREGLPNVSLSDGRAMIGHGIRNLIARAFGKHGRALAEPELDRVLDAFLHEYLEAMPGRSRPYPGVAEVLDRFAAAGWLLAVCTNKSEAAARRLMTLLGLGDRFAVITGQDTFGFSKPDPRHLTETVRAAGGDPSDAVMVGDSPTDVDTAIAAGVPVLAVSFGYSDVPVANIGATAIIDDFAQLWDAVARIRIDAGTHQARRASV